MKLRNFCFIFLAVLLLISCKRENEEVVENKEPYFESEMVDLFTGESKDVELINAEDTVFTVTNDTICEIISSQKNVCRIGALKLGATVLKAVYNDVLYRCVINVTYNEEVEIGAKSMHSDETLVLCTFTYEKEGRIENECFYNNGIPLVETDGKSVYVNLHDSRSYINCPIENFVSFTYDINPLFK